MSRILKRPMFRIGGSTNEGIVSMAQPRKNYQGGSDYEARINELRPILQQAAGPGRSERDRFLDMLLQGSIRLASERPAGNIISTAARAFQEPVSQYLKSGETEDAFQRQINLAAATQGISSVEAERLARIKLADDLQKIQLEKDKVFLTTSGLGSAGPGILSIKKQLEKQGETVLESPVTTVGTGPKAKPVPQAILSIPEGVIFFDANQNFYKRVKGGPGYERIQYSGKKIEVPTQVKEPTFSESPGASYDPRAWNKQRFYEELEKKKNKQSME